MRLAEKLRFKLLQGTYRYHKVAKEKKEADKEKESKKENLLDDVEKYLDGLLSEKEKDKKDNKKEE